MIGKLPVAVYRNPWTSKASAEAKRDKFPSQIPTSCLGYPLQNKK
jgi:hypothetical protein